MVILWLSEQKLIPTYVRVVNIDLQGITSRKLRSFFVQDEVTLTQKLHQHTSNQVCENSYARHQNILRKHYQKHTTH